jgi:hypothetical protein
MGSFTPSPFGIEKNNRIQGDLAVEGTIEFNISKEMESASQSEATMTVFLNEKTNQLTFKVKYSNGKVKQGTVVLTEIKKK